MTMQCAKRVSVIALVALALAKPAWSNGDLFFEAQETPGKPEYVIFGSVKDDRGKYLEGVTVVVSVSDPHLSYTTETGILGRFRTLDVGKAIKGLGYDVDASQIHVAVTHPGYREVRRVSRGKYGQNTGAIEINFVMMADAK